MTHFTSILWTDIGTSHERTTTITVRVGPNGILTKSTLTVKGPPPDYEAECVRLKLEAVAQMEQIAELRQRLA